MNTYTGEPIVMCRIMESKEQMQEKIYYGICNTLNGMSIL